MEIDFFFLLPLYFERASVLDREFDMQEIKRMRGFLFYRGKIFIGDSSLRQVEWKIHVLQVVDKRAGPNP